MNAKGFLIVEDDSDQLAILQMVVEALNRPVYSARSAAEALTYLEKEPLLALVSDIRMPDMDGIELAKSLRNGNSQNASIPVFLVSASLDGLQESLDVENLTLLPKARVRDLLNLLPTTE